ncbi:MAG: hypothetical protein ACR2JY_02605 [Chloroflexota bacterium]
MVATATTADRIESGLALVEGDIRALPVLAEEWEHLGESTQVTLSLDWEHSIADYLAELDEHSRNGQMAPPQQARYWALRNNLQDALPLIQRLGWYIPPVAYGESKFPAPKPDH